MSQISCYNIYYAIAGHIPQGYATRAPSHIIGYVSYKASDSIAS